MASYTQTQPLFTSSYFTLCKNSLAYCTRACQFDLDELGRSRCASSYILRLYELMGDHREIAISTSDTESYLLSVEREVMRYPKRPGSSVIDEMIKNGDIWCIGSNEHSGSHCLITPLEACAPSVTVFDHFVANGRSRPFWLSTPFPLYAQLLRFCVRSRDCDLP